MDFELPEWIRGHSQSAEIMLKFGVDVIEFERKAIASALWDVRKRPIWIVEDVDFPTGDGEVVWCVRQFDELDVLGIGLV